MRLIFLLFLTLNLLNAEKLALLIGNSKYIHLDRLSSPSQDIPALAQKLRDMNFKVTELYDLDEKKMKKSIKDFKKKLLKNPNAIALFYYSGHGSQAYGDSYLIPIDGDTRDEGDVESDGVKVENIANKMATARTKANILFLDACRDVPTGTMGGTKGLGKVNRQPSATLILYSTSKNKTAKDDRVFNKTVLEKLALNMPFSSLANDISYAVGQKTSKKQVPELLSTGLPNVCLSGSCNQQQEVKVVEKIVYRDRPQSYEKNPMIRTNLAYDVILNQNNHVEIIEKIDAKPIEVSKTTNKNIVVIDGLKYQNQPFTLKVFTFQEAEKYCKNLNLQGRGWRLPTKEELMNAGNVKLRDHKYNPNHDTWYDKYKPLINSKGNSYFIKKEFLENMPSSVGTKGVYKGLLEDAHFWTTDKRNSKRWFVSFEGGESRWFGRGKKIHAMCVK